MCSLSWPSMDNHQGDLADVVWAGGRSASADDPAVDWQFPSEPINFPSSVEEPISGFGDPFYNMQDPMLHGMEMAGHMLFEGSDSSKGMVKMNVEEDESVDGGLLLRDKISGEEMQMPCNIFSRMLHISPNTKVPISPQNSSSATTMRGIESTSLDGNRVIKPDTTVSTGLIENGGPQISSVRNPGIKRRKGLAKKVVCIPAPTATNSRPSGEVVPSDLWAWRKYGQKPIKGSPYPRGYYRCSSSKGCSARKQVERSRTDPNMLVITYTSDHNHPWPTQRNALAGSTRSQHMKKDASSKNSSSQTSKSAEVKEEHKENDNNNASSDGPAHGPMEIGTVKEEIEETEKSTDAADRNGEFRMDFDNQSYKRLAPSDSNQSDDFFMDFGELEPDPLKHMLSQDITGDKSDGWMENKGMDPFNLFDW